MTDIVKLGLVEVAELIRQKKLSSTEVTKAALAQIEKTSGLNTFITLAADEALLTAAAVDKKIAAGQSVGALAGVPIAIKDNISTKGIRTTCASRMLENYVPPFDATVVEKLKAADAVILGKLNMDEFAMGSSSEYSYFGAVKNAVDPTRVAGGSSGGSAAAVAAFQCYATLGSDTGGSIRTPAAYNGVVGLKPTYSTVSRSGAIAYASSLDQVGAIARNAADVAAMFKVISGFDPKDTTSYNGDYSAVTAFSGDVKGKKIGVTKEFFSDDLTGDTKTAALAAIDTFKDMGAEIVEVSIGTFPAALAAYYVLSSAEAATNLARFDGVKYGLRAEGADYIEMYDNTRNLGFGDEVKRRIMVGNYVLSSGYYDAYYLKAMRLRNLIKADFDAALSRCDALICPVSPVTAFPLGQKTTDHTLSYLSDLYGVPVNLAGLPAVSFPCGKDMDGMPIGVQLIGAAYNDGMLLKMADLFMTKRGAI